MKIAYFGFDLFCSCLEMLSSSHEIVKIFTCKVDEDFETTHKTYAIANKYSIPITNGKVKKEDISNLEQLGCELIVSAGYYHKIPCSRIIRSVNIHPALLPLGRGPWPMPVSILRGDKFTGITIHELADSFDKGDIILQKSVEILSTDNLETLTDKLVLTAKELLNCFLSDIDRYWIDKRPQSTGEYWKEPGVNEYTFTLKDDYFRIDKITKAFYSFKCFLKSDSKVIEIKKAKCVKNLDDCPKNSQVIEIDNGYLCILQLS